MSVPGRKPPDQFLLKWCLPAFLGGFTGGLLLRATNPKSTILLFVFGIVGSGVGLWISSKREGAKSENFFGELVTMAVVSLSMCYVSLPGTFLALALFK